jgi:hypothetical protein
MENYKRADYNTKLSRYIKILCFRFCGVFPMSRFLRAKIYRRLGVSIEKGVVRIGKISIDTIHPEDIFIGKGNYGWMYSAFSLLRCLEFERACLLSGRNPYRKECIYRKQFRVYQTGYGRRRSCHWGRIRCK